MILFDTQVLIYINVFLSVPVYITKTVPGPDTKQWFTPVVKDTFNSPIFWIIAGTALVIIVICIIGTVVHSVCLRYVLIQPGIMMTQNHK